VVATGVTADGNREVLGLAVGDSEDKVFWTAFLRSLRSRGLTGVRLVIVEIDICAFAAFPQAHWRKIWSTNPLERVNKEIKRRTNVVGIFPNEPAVVRLAGAVLLEVHDEWQISERRYLSEGSMANLYENDNDVGDDKKVGTRTNELLAG
jgi:transposase-like protein